jgi:transcriptional regulator with XRE-family HTH domain
MNLHLAPGAPIASLLTRAQLALGLSQERLGEIVPVSRRTVWRWQSGQSSPIAPHVERIARAVYPRDPALAAELAAAAQTTLAALGLEPERKAIDTQPLLAEAVVCAAAEALDVSPRAVRPALAAAIARAREAGLDLETLAQALAPSKAPGSKHKRKR